MQFFLICIFVFLNSYLSRHLESQTSPVPQLGSCSTKRAVVLTGRGELFTASGTGVASTKGAMVAATDASDDDEDEVSSVTSSGMISVTTSTVVVGSSEAVTVAVDASTAEGEDDSRGFVLSESGII